MSFSKIIFLSTAIMFLFISSAFAQESDDEEEIIVVSAGKIEQSVDNAVEKVQVISKSDIEQSGAKTLSEAVKNLSGVVVTGASAANPVDSISMQGFDSSYVKILVDGIAVTGDIGGSTAVFEIPVEMIERIEVVQGASSALYGSDAMGGVINIITKKSGGEEFSVHADATEEVSFMKSGNYRNYTSATATASAEHFSAQATGSFDFTPGKQKSTYYALSGGNIDYYESPRKMVGYGRASANYSDDWGSLGLFGAAASSDQKSNFTATGFNSGATMEYSTKRLEGGLTGEYVFDNALSFSGFSAVKSYSLDTTYDVKAGVDSSVTDTDSLFVDWESEARASWQMNDANLFLFGVNGNLETVNGDSFNKRQKQLLLSLFAQDTLTIFDGALDIVPGFRADFAPKMDDSSSYFMLTPKLSAKYAPTDATALRFSYGMGYKTPTLKQKYWVFYHNYASGEGNFILYGNPDLKSEKSQSFNASIEQKIGDFVKLTAGAYFNYITDMITSVVTDDTTSPQIRTYENVDKAITYGGEIGASYKYSRFEANAGYAYTAAKAYDSDEGWQDLSLRVTHRITASAGYMIPVLEAKIQASAQWNSAQLVTTGGDDYTPDYFMTGATLSKMFWQDKVEAYIRGDNLLDNLNFKDGTDGQNQKDYFGLTDGTTISIGARIKL